MEANGQAVKREGRIVKFQHLDNGVVLPSCCFCEKQVQRKNASALLNSNDKFHCVVPTSPFRVHIVHDFCAHGEPERLCCEQQKEEPEKKLRFTAIGIDIGGVIVPQATSGDDKEDTLLGDNFLAQEAALGAVDGVAKLVAVLGAEKVFIVSKAGSRVAKQSSMWLSHVGWYEKTGMLKQNVHFVRERRDKAPLCAQLGVSCFIDDNLSVLQHFLTPPSKCEEPLFYFQPHAPETRSSCFYHPRIVHTTSWEDLIEKIAF